MYYWGPLLHVEYGMVTMLVQHHTARDDGYA